MVGMSKKGGAGARADIVSAPRRLILSLFLCMGAAFFMSTKGGAHFELCPLTQSIPSCSNRRQTIDRWPNFSMWVA